MKIRLIAMKPAINWLKSFMLMLNSSKKESMNPDDKQAIDEIIEMLNGWIKDGAINDDDIPELKAIAKSMQTHESLSKEERLKFVSMGVQLSRIRK